MSDRVVLTIGTKKGVFVAEASKHRGKFSLRGPSGQGVASTPAHSRGAFNVYGVLPAALHSRVR